MSAIATQEPPVIKTWRERMGGCEHSPGLVVHSMHEEIAELRTALNVAEEDAARWRKWLPWLRNLNRKPFSLAKEITMIDAMVK